MLFLYQAKVLSMWHVSYDTLFSLIGYPLIWHTDNGKEFGQAVNDAVKEYDPLAYTLSRELLHTKASRLC
jgi:hypothetical protein